MIALIDYGAGNLTSVKKALNAVGVDYRVPATPAECTGAAGLIVPGVGNFAATANSTLTLWCDGGTWYEVSRSTN